MAAATATATATASGAAAGAVATNRRCLCRVRRALRSSMRGLALLGVCWVATFAGLLGRQLLLVPVPVPPNLPDADATATTRTTTTPPAAAAFGAPTDGVLTVGVAVTVTGCDDMPHLLDGAVVLRHSFLRQPSDRYQYQFYAIYHPDAAGCVSPLAQAGFVLLQRQTPINVSAIRGEFLRRTLPTSGCCGERELLKFEAFLLTQHPAVIIVDVDVLVLRPLDEVIDVLLSNNRRPDLAMRHLQQKTTERRHNGTTDAAATGDIWLLYVHDYNMAEPPYLVTPSQGGLAIIKPNRTIYSDIQQIVVRGDYHEVHGWGNVTGVFLGSETYQGLLPYYFQILNPGHALALNWCKHDNMCTGRSEWVTRGEERVERCYAPNCQDCSRVALEDVDSIHFTVCDKPWRCVDPDWVPELCEGMHRAWFQTRSELEESWGRSGRGSSNQTAAHNALGYCSEFGEGGYEAIRQPYGVPV